MSLVTTLRRLSARARGLLMPLVLLSSSSLALANPWTSPGSAGVVDESDTGIIEFINGEARIKAAAPAGSVAVLRYNVVSLGGMTGPGSAAFRVRFLDNGPGARTQVTLKRYRLGYAASPLDTIDSNAWTSQVGYQTQQHCIPVDWQFDDSVYYVEVTLTKSAADGQAGLAAIQILPGYCGPL